MSFGGVVEVPNVSEPWITTPAQHSTVADAINGEKTFSQLLATMDEMDPQDYLPRFKAITESEFYALSDEEQTLMKEVVRAALWQEHVDYYRAQGLEPPPPGYTYAQLDGGPPELIKRNEPNIRVYPEGSEGYGAYWQLSDTEWERYIALYGISTENTGVAKRYGLSSEGIELAKIWYQQLHEKTWGKKPDVVSYSSYSRPVTAEDREKERRMITERRQAINPPTRSRRVNYDVVEQLIRELKEEINR